MLYRKIGKEIENHLLSETDRIMIVEGARQIGKSFIIRTVGKRLFRNFVEINLVEDAAGNGLFGKVKTTEDFYFALSSIYGSKLGDYSDTLVFIDEIQQYPQFMTLLKFLRQERRYRYITSGSLLGVTLRSTTSIPVGSVVRKQMYQLDFEEFLIANGTGTEAIEAMRRKWAANESLDEPTHEFMMTMFRRYLLVGGMPDAVNEYLNTKNIIKVREIQNAIHLMYKDDALKYTEHVGRELQVRRIYDMIPSQMENKKKRIVAKDILGQSGDRFSRYQDEFEYLITSGVTLDVHAIANPKYPLAESVQKNLLKLYLNDVGMLTGVLYRNNIQPVMYHESSINLGAVYENVVAQELKAHGYNLFYYDNRKNGEVDFLIDDYNNLTALPIEVKSGKDYTVHSALNRLLSTPDYHITRGIVLSNNRIVTTSGAVVYMPVYYVMFFDAAATSGSEFVF